MSKRCNFTRKDGFHCGSFAFNLHQDQIDQGDLCDVHYWQSRCIDAAKVNERIRALMASNAELVEALGRIAEGDVMARLKKKSWTSSDVITQYQAIASAVLAKHESNHEHQN